MKYLLSFLVISPLLFISCRKNGEGGKSKINVHCTYGNNNAPNSIVHIKYGANNFPGPGSNYNQTDTADYAGRFTFDPLLKGDYYIYVEYTDSTDTSHHIGGGYMKIDNPRGEDHIVIDVAQEPQ